MEIREVQIILTDMLVLLNKICGKYSVKYWIDSGTLLGAVRHKGFIPWDDDIDICMMRDEYNKFLECVKKEKLDPFYIDDKNSTKVGWTKICYNLRPDDIETQIVASIDIFPMDIINEKHINDVMFFIYRKAFSIKTPKNVVEKLLIKFKSINKWEAYLTKINKENKNSSIICYGVETALMCKEYYLKESYVFPLKHIKFEKYKLLGPNNPHKYLEKYYGNYMTLPKKSERITHYNYSNAVNEGEFNESIASDK